MQRGAPLRHSTDLFATMKHTLLLIAASATALSVALTGCNRSGPSSDQAGAAAVSGAAQSGPAVSAPATAASDAPAGASQ